MSLVSAVLSLDSRRFLIARSEPQYNQLTETHLTKFSEHLVCPRHDCRADLSLAPPSRSESVQVILNQLHRQGRVSRPAPAIALNAARSTVRRSSQPRSASDGKLGRSSFVTKLPVIYLMDS